VGAQLGQLTQAQQQALLSGGQALSAAEQQEISQRLSGAGQVGQIGTQMGALTQQQQSALMQAAQQTGALTGQQQQLLANIGTQSGQLTQADLQRQQSALTQMAAMAQQGQQMRATDVASLDAIGQARQQQAQREADAKYQQDLLEKNYPKAQLDWLSTQVRGRAPIAPSTQTQQGYTTTVGPSALQQLATGAAATAGLNKLIGGT
jgi:hypothetical protein